MEERKIAACDTQTATGARVDVCGEAFLEQSGFIRREKVSASASVWLVCQGLGVGFKPGSKGEGDSTRLTGDEPRLGVPGSGGD